MIWLKQSTAATVPMGPFVDDTDFKTVETALSLTQAETRLSKNGGAFAQKNDVTTASHMEEGSYGIVLDATDTNTLGRLRIQIQVTGALIVWQDFMIVPANVWDSLFGADLLQVDTREVTGTAQTAGDIIGDTNDIQARLPAALVGGRIAANAEVVGDKTGYGLSAAAVQAIWDALTSALTTASSIGKLLVDNINATISSRATPAQVNTEVVDALNVDTYAEPGQEVPPATTTLVKKIGYLYKLLRNRVTQTATTLSIYNDDAVTVDQKATVSDNGTTFDRGEITTGP